jgi:hypothetical protein
MTNIYYGVIIYFQLFLICLYGTKLKRKAGITLHNITLLANLTIGFKTVMEFAHQCWCYESLLVTSSHPNSWQAKDGPGKLIDIETKA